MRSRQLPASMLALLLTLVFGGFASLGGCASLGKCESASCADDAVITEQVRSLFGEHPELGAPAALGVRTINHVVYLNGLLDTDLQRNTAEALALQVANVKDVVNSISIRNSGR